MQTNVGTDATTRRRRFGLVMVLTVLAAGWPALLPSEGPGYDVTRRTIGLAFAEGTEQGWVSEIVEAPATVAGLTWQGEAPERAWVRSRDTDGWSPWVEVEVDDEHAPDPGTVEATADRAASAPVIVGDAEALQFKVEIGSAEPRGLSAEVVDAEQRGRSAHVREFLDEAGAAPSQPRIVTRDQWGGDECLARKSSQDAPTYVRRVEVMFVHHTASTNDYTEAEAAGLVRSFCEYHVYSRGWDDIGYNFLVDKYGNVYEGRAGGVEQGVQGAHTGGFNSYSTGVAFIGTHGTLAPSSAAQQAFTKLAAWKLDVHHVDPAGSSKLVSHGSSKYRSGTTVTMRNVSGHRDASSTSCPGDQCYLLLDDFRSQIRGIGGPKIFGGWPTPDPISGSPERGYQTATFSGSLSHTGTWTFEIRHEGKTLLRRTGAGDRFSYTWDGTVNGRRQPVGNYEVRVDANTSAGTPRPLRQTFQLGSFLPPFADDDGSVHEPDISYIAQAGVTKGCNPPTNDRFCPSDPVLREQMAAFLVRALGLTRTSGHRFADVPRGSTFETDIDKLATAGITRGCNPPRNDRFCPGSGVTREQMAAFLARGFDYSATSGHTFEDVEPRSTFAVDIDRLATAGVTKGCNPPNNTRFCPTDQVTRGQMASFLARALRQR